MLKKGLRTAYKNRRKTVSNAWLSHASLSIANSLLELPIWHLDYYHIFLPILQQREIDTQFVLSMLQRLNKHVLVPKVINNSKLKHYLLTDTTKFRMNSWRIPEPVDGVEIMSLKIDVVFIPLLAFDVKGNRVGYGKGFYDEFLKECREDVLKIGLSLFEAEEVIDDIDEHDVPLDYCVTPTKIYSFSDLAT